MNLINLKNENILPFRFKKLKSGKIFISNEIGKWMIMEEPSFIDFVEGRELSHELKSNLINERFLKPDNLKNEDEFIRFLAGRRLVRYRYLMHGPSLHIIVVTLACNHACRYCHASAVMSGGEKYHMSKPMAQKVVDTIFETTAGNITIEFQGGEPLANWDVVKFVVEYAREKNKTYKLKLNFALISNLTLLDEEKIDFLMADDIGISTSLDGPKEVHDQNRLYSGKGSSFEEVTGWIKRVNEEYVKRGMRKKVGAIATATRKSLEYPKEIVDTYIALGLDNIFIRPLNPYGFAGRVWDKIGYPKENYVDFYKILLAYIKQKQSEGVRISDSYVDGICISNLTSPEILNYMEERSPCGATLGQVGYNWDGGIYTCDEGRMLATTGDDSFKVGDIDLTKTSKEIYQSMLLNYVTRLMIYSSAIDFVPGYQTNPISSFIGLCPIYSYTTGGNIMSKYRKETRFNIQESVFENIFENIQDIAHKEVAILKKM